MKMSGRSQGFSRWTLGGLVVFLGAGGLLTFGTPGDGQVGCGGGYYDEDLDVVVTEDSPEAEGELIGGGLGIPIVPFLRPYGPIIRPAPRGNACSIDVPVNLCCTEETGRKPTTQIPPQCDGDRSIGEWLEDTRRWFKEFGDEVEAAAKAAKKHCEEDDGWLGNSYRLAEILDRKRPLLSGTFGPNGSVGYSVTCEIKGFDWRTGRCDEVWLNCELVW
jgi:hypothetical protein